ncbi:MAG: hypothetical protein AB9M53_01045 [Leptothrix sp. (in: b-proteobacteria)]
MAQVKISWGAKSALTVAGLSTLASATYALSSAYSLTTNNPIDLAVEVSVATTNAPTGNQQVVVFAQASYDGGVTWQSGPTSGTTVTDEPDLTFIGTVPVRTASVTHTKQFTVAQAYGGNPPPLVRFVLKNDLGVALTSAAVATSEASATVV